MANDYVGNAITNYLCEKGEKIDYFVYSLKGDASYNDGMIDLVRSASSSTIVLNYEEFLSNQNEIRDKNIDFGILAWWPHILKEETIRVTQRGFINTHPALLPFCRGKHPYFWCMYDDEPFGVTLHWIDEKIDKGDVIAQRKIDYNWEDTGESLYQKGRDEMIELFKESYDAIRDGRTQTLQIDWSDYSFHYGNQLEEVCRIDLDKEYKARDLFNIIRGRMFGNRGQVSFAENGENYKVSIKIDKQ